MKMLVFLRPSKTPIVIESNITWALPYWIARKTFNPLLHWRIEP